VRRLFLIAVAVAALVAALALASCGGGSDDAKTSSAPASPGPTGTSGATGSAGKAPRPSGRRLDTGTPDERAPAGAGDAGRFDRASVKVSFVEKAFFGAKSQVVYFVARGDGLAQAKACVAAYRGKAPSVYCFGFASDRAFRFAGVSRRPPSAMKRPCWSAWWGQPKDRRAFGSGDNPAAATLHCPGA
jgi:hypothetical protein